jgi:hypothetical protein
MMNEQDRHDIEQASTEVSAFAHFEGQFPICFSTASLFL